MQAAQGACCAPGHPEPLSPKAEPGSRAAGPPPWGPCRHLQGQNPERVLHPYLQQQTGCHKHNLFLLVLASCLQWGLILQREVDSLFSECRCVCGSHLTTSPHPSLSSSLHPITSSEYPHIPASPQPLCPEHRTPEHPSPTQHICPCRDLSLPAQQQTLPSMSDSRGLIQSFLPMEFNCNNSTCCSYVILSVFVFSFQRIKISH